MRRRGTGSAVVAALPPALAIGVFGTIYGALAPEELGTQLTLLSSAIVFSGALQFATLQLLAAHASIGVILVAAVLLNVRHVLLGAALRPRIQAPRWRRAVLAWFMIDEAAGLALTAKRPAVVLFVTGAMGYAAWVGGTALGLWGATLADLDPLAGAVFPVLFVGLAAISVRARSDVVRAILASIATVVVALMWPALRPVVPAAAAVAVAFVGGDE